MTSPTTIEARQRHIPSDATPFIDDKSDAAVYFYRRGALWCARGFHGRCQKPAWRYNFGTSQEAMADHIAGYFRDRRNVCRRKAEEKAKGHPLKVGDILVSTWGYDQTNVNFYRVVKLNGKTMVTLQSIAAKVETPARHLAMSDYVTADLDSRGGKPFRVKPDSQGRVGLSSYSSASPWNGKPQYRSWYA